MREMIHPLLLLLASGLALVESQFFPSLSSVLAPTIDDGFCPCQRHPVTGLPALFWQRSADDVQFRLYTRSNNEGSPDEIKLGNKNSLDSSSFNSKLPVKFITHGYTEGPQTAKYVLRMKDAILSEDDVNVILVYWQRLASSQDYLVSAKNSLFVGKIIADLLHFIKDNTKDFSGHQVHLIGFSMGAQASGVAGYHFPGIARITGLDPAGPSYECVDAKNRLDPSDAEFVDVIHTNGGCLATGHIGNRAALGHLDFYVNGGSDQPGCENLFLDVAKGVFTNTKIDICSHDRARDLFIESIKAPETPYGFLCDNFDSFKSGNCFDNPKVEFGYRATMPTVTGTYHLETLTEEPHLARQVKLDIKVSTAHPSTFFGSLNFAVPLQNRKNTQSVIMGEFVPGNVYTTSVPVPLGTPTDDVNFSVVPQRIFTSSFTSSSIVGETLFARDTSLQNEYCLASNIVLVTPEIYSLKPVRGSC